MIKISKKNSQILILKHGFNFLAKYTKIYGEELVITNTDKNSFIKSNKRFFFSFPNIKGRCERLYGNLKTNKFTFKRCKLTINLKNGLKMYTQSAKVKFFRLKSSLILEKTYLTTCSLPKPHYKVLVERLYVVGRMMGKKTSIDKVYVKDMKNILFIPFTGFRKSFYLVRNGQQKKVIFRGVNFYNKGRFKRTLTLYLTNTFYFTKKSELDFNIYPSYSTKRGFFVSYEGMLNTPVLSDKNEIFYLHDKIKNPSSEFEKAFFPPPTRDRFFYHSYGNIKTKNFSTKYEIYKISDKSLLQELFPGKFKNEKTPETYLDVQKFYINNVYLWVFIRPNLNPFISQTEYLPLMKFGVLNFNITDRINLTSTTSFSYLDKKIDLPVSHLKLLRLVTKNFLTYNLYDNLFNINLYSGFGDNLYSNRRNSDLKNSLYVFYGIDLTRSIVYPARNYSYFSLWEVKFLASQNLSKIANNALFFDKEDINANSGELYLSTKNNFIFKNFEIEYDVYSEIYTRKIVVGNQTSFLPFEFLDNFNTSTKQSSHIQDLKFKISDFTIATRYENNLGKLITSKPYLYSVYGEYRNKNKFILRMLYNVSTDIANAVEVSAGLKLVSNYYVNVFMNYYIDKHRIINNILTVTKDFHDFYFSVMFSRDTIRNEIRFAFSIEPKWGEKNILEKTVQELYFRR